MRIKYSELGAVIEAYLATFFRFFLRYLTNEIKTKHFSKL